MNKKAATLKSEAESYLLAEAKRAGMDVRMVKMCIDVIRMETLRAASTQHLDTSPAICDNRAQRTP